MQLRSGLETPYDYRNKYLEKESKKQRKIRELSAEYGETAWKMRFHELDEEGQRVYGQLKRDRVLTTTGWSILGSLVGFMVANSVTGSRRYLRARSPAKQVSLVLTSFSLPLIGLTYHGYAKARQDFVKGKLALIDRQKQIS